MPLPIIPNTFRVAVKHTDTAGLNHAVNVMHVLTGGPVTPATLFGDLNTAIGGNQPFKALSGFFTEAGMECAITPLDGTSPTQVFTSTDAGWSGDSGGDPILELAMRLTLYTAKRGRSYRGRLFIGPVGESVQNTGVLTDAIVDDTTAGFDAWANALVAIGPTFCVASYRHATSEPVTTVRGHKQAGTQRKRLTRIR
jgi:hypothetical protein